MNENLIVNFIKQMLFLGLASSSDIDKTALNLNFLEII